MSQKVAVPDRVLLFSADKSGCYLRKSPILYLHMIE